MEAILSWCIRFLTADVILYNEQVKSCCIMFMGKGTFSKNTDRALCCFSLYFTPWSPKGVVQLLEEWNITIDVYGCSLFAGFGCLRSWDGPLSFVPGRTKCYNSGKLEFREKESLRGTHSLWPNVILIGPPVVCEICSKYTFTFIIFIFLGWI